LQVAPAVDRRGALSKVKHLLDNHRRAKILKDMLERSPARLDRVFHALSHRTRRRILRRVAERECSVSELAKPFNVTLEAVSQHIRVLERAGLVQRTRRGRVHHCRLQPKPLRDAAAVLNELETYWTARLDGLERYFTRTDK
jgi:DNA-binding transcriptional ArsR family regulator